jgi:hypothetical protein
VVLAKIFKILTLIGGGCSKVQYFSLLYENLFEHYIIIPYLKLKIMMPGKNILTA